MMKRGLPARPWSTALIAFVIGFTIYTFLFGNPISQRVIFSPDFGQSPKLIAVLQTLEPLPALGPNWQELFTFSPRRLLVLGLIYIWVVGLTVIFGVMAPRLAGAGWQRGLPYALIVWAIAFPLLEFFFPFNVLGEPLPLVAYELLLEIGICAGLAIPIAALTPQVD